MKVVINKCYGGYGLSGAAMQEIAKRKGLVASPFGKWGWWLIGPEPLPLNETGGDEPWPEGYIDDAGIKRNDPDLVAVVEALGSEAASGRLSKLKVVEIPDGVEYEIDEYDGIESIHEVRRSWG